MTTEIAVINRLGIALAADSAVTIPGYGADKVFDTGDKLFELSERYPVALMVNGSMDFLGVLWELVAKEFRCTTPTDAEIISIADWMKRFLAFVAKHQAVTPAPHLRSRPRHVGPVARRARRRTVRTSRGARGLAAPREPSSPKTFHPRDPRTRS